MKWSFSALGTTWWIEIWDDITDKNRTEIVDFCSVFVSQYENNYSRFQPDSLLSQLNRERTFANPSDECIQLLTYGKQLYLRTDSVFNFLTGHILEARGYDADYSFTDTGSSDLRPGNPITDLVIAPERIELHHGNIDLGGYGKGYLIDLLVNQFKTHFCLEQFLINGGGDMYATHKDSQPLQIHLEHPTKPGTMIGSTTLKNQGFAASSPHKRHWPGVNGTEQTHIVAEHLTADATFIKSPSAADADAFATTALQLGQPDLERLAKSEQLGIGLFDITSGKLVSNPSFV